MRPRYPTDGVRGGGGGGGGGNETERERETKFNNRRKKEMLMWIMRMCAYMFVCVFVRART